MLYPRKVPLPGTGGRIVRGVLVVLLLIICLGSGFFAGTVYQRNKYDRSVLSGAASDRPSTAPGKASPPASICTNTCSKARNGVCDEGRGNVTSNGAERLVYCDLGTDCEDCDAWKPSGPVSWASGRKKGPIALLMAKGVEVRVKLALTPDPFIFAYTDPEKDVDVSRHLNKGGLLEPGISQLFYKIFKGRCIKANGTRSLFVDVGANFGWYSALAASMGCRVVAFEPVPHFHAFLEYTVHVNGLASLVYMRSNVISHESNKEMQMVVPDRGIWGTAGIDGINIDNNIKGNIEKFMVMSYRVEDLVKEDVILMKIDVEGWEWSVMQGAMKMLKQYNVENIVMEYSPGAVEHSHNHAHNIATVQMLVDIINAGYRIGNIDYRTNHIGWDDDTPVVQEVVAGNLKYDIADAHLRRAAKLGCPIPTELLKVWAWGALGCESIPEDVNPRSFRSIIGHNTNIWASKNRTLQRVEGKVGIMNLDDPPTKFFITNKDGLGAGARVCNDLPQRVQVRHRCRCVNKTLCGEEERLVERLAAEGKLPNNYVLP